MGDFPSKLIPPLCMGTIQNYGPVQSVQLVSGTTGNITWPAANQACYVPVSFPFYFPVKRVWWVNGSVVTGNMDMGIYTWDGVQLYHQGSTAQSGSSTCQFATVSTPFILVPGKYYFALACSGTSTNAIGITTVTTNEGRLGGLRQQATALPLPSSATFAQWASTGLPAFGVSQ